MSLLRFFSKRWKQITTLIVMMLVVGTFITKAPQAIVKTEGAFYRVRQLMHAADTDRREVRPLPLLG
jgi:hypothetical protein